MRMLRPILAALIFASLLLRCAASGLAATPQPLTSIQAIHALTNAQANQAIPVRFEASVTYYKKGDVDLFVQDGDTAIYIETSTGYDLSTGDRVLVTGYTRASFRPEVKGDSITLLHHGQAADPVNATFQQLIHADLDSRRVTVRGTVLSANVVLDGGLQNIYLQLLMDGGSVDAEVVNNGSNVADLLDSEVEITGAVAGRFDNKMQMTGILIETPSLSDVTVLKRAASVPSALPVTPMDQILGAYNVVDRTQRIRVQGTVTYYEPGLTVVLQDGDKSLLVFTQYEGPLPIGSVVSVSGFPNVRKGSLALDRGEIEPTGKRSPVAPQALKTGQLASGAHAFDLISVQGELLMAIREDDQDEYVLVADGHLFSAVLRHPQHGPDTQLPKFKEPAIGSTVRTTGICTLDNGDRSLSPVAFDVLLRSQDDIAVVAGPSLLSVDNLILVVVVLLVVILAAAARQWRIERRVRRQTALLAQIEQRRSRILEEINGARPVDEILEMILDLMSFKLRGAACWLERAEGESVGAPPKSGEEFRIAQSAITSPSGLPIGTVFAAMPRTGKPLADEEATLTMAAGLATLAVETRRLYSDLKHRSEFDLLTDCHNRFSLDRRLNQLIKEYGGTTRKFGLVYVDLDGFKQVNDIYGHKVGDIYLQKVALRMKHQLRAPDMLARLGGDEFAVLIPQVGDKEDAEAIASRLERCFDQPFAVDGNQIEGRASLGIAIYPQDSSTKDGILNAADAAMYVSKHAKGQRRAASRGNEESKLAPSR